MKFNLLFSSVAGLIFVAALPAHAQQQATVWTLANSVQRALSLAPELHATDAEIAARAGDLTQAEAWPNPTVALRADGKMDADNGRGGSYDFNQVTVTQALPLGRIQPQRRVATASLEAARAEKNNQQLLLETKVAHAYHTLQLTAERQRLAQQRLAFAEALPQRDKQSGKDLLVRYLSPLEHARLDMLRATAHQDVALAEGKWSEALAQFRTLLALPPDAIPETTRLAPIDAPSQLGALLDKIETHPALQATQRTRDASLATIDLARAQRFSDPEVSVFVERDNLNGARRNYSGIMLGVVIPLGNSSKGRIARARGEADKAEAILEVQRRDLSSRLRQAHLHLEHLIEQSAHLHIHLLQPARRVLDLTRRGYFSGEQNGLALIEASNTYFDAEARYLELLRDAWIEAAELRLAAGIALGDSTIFSSPEPTHIKGTQP